jgi:hypothetical protein
MYPCNAVFVEINLPVPKCGHSSAVFSTKGGIIYKFCPPFSGICPFLAKDL